jgi:hypothetical protein
VAIKEGKKKKNFRQANFGGGHSANDYITFIQEIFMEHLSKKEAPIL